jgi:hypothetical protein
VTVPTGRDKDAPAGSVRTPSETGGASRGLESLVIATFGLFGLRLGLQPLSDNSMFLHLRTGIDMATTWHVPRTDPYSFTALHHSWVVESWFAELLYGLAYRAGGLHLVILEQGVLMAALAIVISVLARAGTTLRTIAAAGVAVFAGAALWSQRPLLFGLLALALTILVVEQRRSPWWLLPIGWVWVNTHGSFVLGALWLGGTYVGTAIQEKRRPRELERYGLAFAAAMCAGMANPFGPRLVAFPLVVESKAKVFQTIVEWRSPNFQSAGELFALVFFSLGLLILIRRGAPLRDSLVVVGFLALGLISVRNLSPAAVVLAPALGRAMGSRGAVEPAAGASQGAVAGPGRVLRAVLAVAALIFLVGSYRTSGLRLHNYPVGAEDYLAAHHLLAGQRIATQDFVGDYRELVEGIGPSKVFIDDRYDMYPTSVTDDYDALLAAHSAALNVLNRWDIQIVMWQRYQGLPDELDLAGGWKAVYTDKSWEVLVRSPGTPPHVPK